jgi:hypothetical protein
MILNVNGQTVEVDDSYRNLSPDDQHDTIRDIQNQMGMHQDYANQQQNQPTQQPPSTLSQAGDAALAVGKAGVDLAMAHPALAGAAAAAAFPNVASKVPGVGTAMDLANGAVNALKNYNLNQAAHQELQYAKNGITPPSEFTQHINNLRQAAQPAATQATEAAPSFVQKAMQYGDTVRKIALDKVMQGAGALGDMGAAAAKVAAPLAAPFALPMTMAAMNTPEELKILQDAEAKRKAQGWQPANLSQGKFFSSYGPPPQQATGPVQPQ